MSNGFLRIEWSGYLDFPAGNYSFGSKSGENISGVFNINDVDMMSMGSSDYSIDPGELTMPVSNSVSFTLKNRDKFSGELKYDYDFISNLGRTAEYGGHNDEFGDLFIRIYSPILGKYIHTGFVESFKYTRHDMDLEIESSDFMSLLSDKEDKILNSFNFPNSKFYLKDHRGDDLSQNQGEIIGKFRPGPFNINSSTILKGREGRTHVVQQFEIGDVLSSLALYGTDPAVYPYDFEKTEIYKDVITDNNFDSINFLLRNMISGDHPSVNFSGTSPPFHPDFLIRVFSNNPDLFNVNSSNTEITTDLIGSNVPIFLSTISTQREFCFLKIEDSTILSPIITTIYFYFRESPAVRGSLELSLRWRISSVHANNGNIDASHKGQDLIIFERGRFLRNEKNPEDAILKNGDDVSLTIYDWEKYTGDSENRFFLSEGWETQSHGSLTSFKNNFLLHGIYFELDTENNHLVAAGNDRGRINVLDSIIDNINSKIIQDYILNPPSFNLFDVSNVDGDLFKTVFVSDLAQYGWADKDIKDIIVDMARQINCYIYINENGKITLHSRNLFKKFVHAENHDLFTEILVEDYDEISGKEYGYGKMFYSISYNDIIEVNNLISANAVTNIVGRSGVTRKAVSPRKLTISNYRTSDLGIPDSITRAKSPNFVVLRDPIDSSDSSLFIMLPEDQAVQFANSYPFPTILLPIRLDVLFREDYLEIGIGSLIFITNEDESFSVFIVKEISYRMQDIYEGGVSLNIALLQLTTFADVFETIVEFYEDSILLSEDFSDVDDYTGSFPELQVTFSGTSNGDFTLNIFHQGDGFDDPDITDISILNGETPNDIVTKIVNRLSDGGGSEAEGVATFSGTAVSEQEGGEPAVASITFSGNATDDFSIIISHSGFGDSTVNDIEIFSGYNPFDVVGAIINVVNSTPGLSYTATDGGGGTLILISKSNGQRSGEGFVFSKEGQSGFGSNFGVSANNETPSFEGGSEGSGDIKDSFNIVLTHTSMNDSSINDIVIDEGDTAIDIATKVQARINGDSDLSYTASRSSAQLTFTSKEVGSRPFAKIKISKEGQTNFGSSFGVSVSPEEVKMEGGENPTVLSYSYIATNEGGGVIKFRKKSPLTSDHHNVLFTKNAQSGFGSTFNVTINNENPTFTGGV